MERQEYNSDAGPADIPCNHITGSEDRSAEGDDDGSAHFRRTAPADECSSDKPSAYESDTDNQSAADNNGGEDDRADHIDRHGVFVGNHHYPILEAIEALAKL